MKNIKVAPSFLKVKKKLLFSNFETFYNFQNILERKLSFLPIGPSVSEWSFNQSLSNWMIRNQIPRCAISAQKLLKDKLKCHSENWGLIEENLGFLSKLFLNKWRVTKFENKSNLFSIFKNYSEILIFSKFLLTLQKTVKKSVKNISCKILFDTSGKMLAVFQNKAFNQNSKNCTPITCILSLLKVKNICHFEHWGTYKKKSQLSF